MKQSDVVSNIGNLELHVLHLGIIFNIFTIILKTLETM